jgi:hypothetical protein
MSQKIFFFEESSLPIIRGKTINTIDGFAVDSHPVEDFFKTPTHTGIGRARSVRESSRCCAAWQDTNTRSSSPPSAK